MAYADGDTLDRRHARACDDISHCFRLEQLMLQLGRRHRGVGKDHDSDDVENSKGEQLASALVRLMYNLMSMRGAYLPFKLIFLPVTGIIAA
jgi:hypothetical protein